MITFLIGVGLLLAFLVFCNRIIGRDAAVDATIVWESRESGSPVEESIERAIVATREALPADGKPHRVMITAGDGVIAQLDGEEIYREPSDAAPAVPFSVCAAAARKAER